MDAAKEIINRLRRKIRLYESFEESALYDLTNLTDDELVAFSFRTSNQHPIALESAYKELWSRHPYLPLKLKPETFSAWVVLHKMSDLNEIIKKP
jgi:hypothetical protein